jgi:hypothetical protein
MVEQIFGALFVLTLVAPVAAIVAGAALLAWPRGKVAQQMTVSRHAHAQA